MLARTARVRRGEVVKGAPTANVQGLHFDARLATWTIAPRLNGVGTLVCTLQPVRS
jgi:hypothetical protein